MTSVLSFILQVHDSVHDFTMKPNYNEPKIYTGGVEIDQWSKYTKKEQKAITKQDLEDFKAKFHGGRYRPVLNCSTNENSETAYFDLEKNEVIFS